MADKLEQAMRRIDHSIGCLRKSKLAAVWVQGILKVAETAGLQPHEIVELPEEVLATWQRYLDDNPLVEGQAERLARRYALLVVDVKRVQRMLPDARFDAFHTKVVKLYRDYQASVRKA